MRITGPGRLGSGAPNGPARRVGSGQFSLESANAPAPANQAPAPRTVGGIDALLALQGLEEPLERRRRAIKRGRNALDVLDHLKISMLDGALDTSTLGRLKAAAEGLKQGSGDAGLDAVLAEIELRVEVELAKAARA
jgi:hypothetical protein